MIDYSGLKIAVIGDLILDVWIDGKCARLSQEAPVPIVSDFTVRHSYGGAGNVAQNLGSLGVEAYLVTVIGLNCAKYCYKPLDIKENFKFYPISDSIRPPTIKTRISVNGHQICRFDEESTEPVSGNCKEELFETAIGLLPEVDAVIFSDYDKGCITKDLIKPVIDYCNTAGKPVFADPKYRNFWDYKGVDIIKCNEVEANNVIPFGSYSEKSHRIAEKVGGYCVLTIGSNGIMIGKKSIGKYTEFPNRIPAHKADVVDVTGAGDTVMAVLACEYLRTKDIDRSCKLANYAGSLAVQKGGTGVVTVEELSKFDGIHN